LKQSIYICLISLLLVSCDFFKKSEDLEPVARVNDTYLYKESLKDVVPKDASEADSTLLVNTYINRWARQLLLMDGALVNLSEEKQNEFSKDVKYYLLF